VQGGDADPRGASSWPRKKKVWPLGKWPKKAIESPNRAADGQKWTTGHHVDLVHLSTSQTRLQPCNPPSATSSESACLLNSTLASWDRRPHRLHHLLSRTSILSGLFLIRYLQSCNTLATHKGAIVDHEQKQDSVQCYYAFASLRHATTFSEVSVVGAAQVRAT
jgi:hypothetical protein